MYFKFFAARLKVGGTPTVPPYTPHPDRSSPASRAHDADTSFNPFSDSRRTWGNIENTERQYVPSPNSGTVLCHVLLSYRVHCVLFLHEQIVVVVAIEYTYLAILIFLE